MTDSSIVSQAITNAQRIVKRNITERGLAASIEGYPQVWARDTVITFMGGMLLKQEQVNAGFKLSLKTLAQHQDRFGQIPFLVDIKSGSPSFGASDSNQWFVIGAAHYVAQTNDHAWAAEHAAAIIKALDYCEIMDLGHSGLMVSPECADWADLLSNHGNVLFPNVLAAHAYTQGAQLISKINPEDAARFTGRAKLIREKINELFWVKQPNTFSDKAHNQMTQNISISLRHRPYFLPWIGSFDYGDFFDTTANLLAIVTDVASPEQAKKIFSYIDQVGCNRPYPVRVIHPPIMPQDKNWRDYYKIFNCNLPYQYHNSGIWPWVGGLYIAALVHAGMADRAQSEIERLAESLKLGSEEWECNEWLHGQTGVPMGAKYQAWSAGMFIYAHHAVTTGTTPGFTTENY